MAHLSAAPRAERQGEGLAAARPEEACGEIKCQFAARSKNRIHWLISTRAKTVLEVRLAAAGRAVGRLWARQGEGLCRNNNHETAATMSHETRRLSCGRIDDVEAVQHRIDAIDATTSSLSSFFTFIFSTLRQYRAAEDLAGAGRGPCRPVLAGVGLAAAHHAVEGHEEVVLRGEWR